MGLGNMKSLYFCKVHISWSCLAQDYMYSLRTKVMSLYPRKATLLKNQSVIDLYILIKYMPGDPVFACYEH